MLTPTAMEFFLLATYLTNYLAWQKMVFYQVGYEIFEVESLDCNWMERKLGLKPTDSGTQIRMNEIDR